MIGFYTLFKREVARFLLDVLDTIAPPTASVLLYLLIFGTVLGPRLGAVEGVHFAEFMAPGLLLMAVVMNSFLNPAYSVFQSRWDGNIADFLSSPLSSAQIALAVILAGMVRGLIVGALVALVALVAWGVIGFQWAHPWVSAMYLALVSLTFASLGSVVGLWTRGWEGVNAITVFVLDPLVLLGGVFYSLEMVSGVPLLNALTAVNPFTRMIGGLRFAMLGTAEIPLWQGLALTVSLAVVALAWALWLFRRGYKPGKGIV